MTDVVARYRQEPCEGHRGRAGGDEWYSYTYSDCIGHGIEVAPMIDHSDTFFRYYMRMFTRCAPVWTEMLVDNTILNCDNLPEYVHHYEIEHPVVCQLGQSNVLLSAYLRPFFWLLCPAFPRPPPLPSSFPTHLTPALLLPACPVPQPPCLLLSHPIFQPSVSVSSPLTIDALPGGSNPTTLAEAAAIVESWGYDEINLNCGCPSERVAGKSCFGAALMREAETVREIVSAMRKRVSVPVSVKTRLGIDDLDCQEFTEKFVETVAASGCSRFIMHARKAFLKGLSAAQNRTVPPLHYDRVFRLKKKFPFLSISINGQIRDLDLAEDLIFARGNPKGESLWPEDGDTLMESVRAESLLWGGRGAQTEGASSASSGSEEIMGGRGPRVLSSVMMGRAALNNCSVFADADRRFYGRPNPPTARTRRTALDGYLSFLEENFPEAQMKQGRLFQLVSPVLGTLGGQSGNRQFRQKIDSEMRGKKNLGRTAASVIEAAIDLIDEQYPQVLDMAIYTDEGVMNKFDHRDTPRWHASEASAGTSAGREGMADGGDVGARKGEGEGVGRGGGGGGGGGGESGASTLAVGDCNGGPKKRPLSPSNPVPSSEEAGPQTVSSSSSSSSSFLPTPDASSPGDAKRGKGAVKETSAGASEQEQQQPVEKAQADLFGQPLPQQSGGLPRPPTTGEGG
uniref:DUS-like FMN-binding domain-containing protein n=1 Tax=Chromera velia CCMP2878 TaxID=1169474 RepID=A0A0G4H2G7_9ALVE|eukprot:Cvel_24375.t1-p1 / transcript=Cvel_24375.t1 / gene=Cvel_24375 / organism=Chromera_velia_CCMP2878 / gene_product=tRNA-dihydrouridine synthase A, putative / transcript_product=tRNA-dihydrouridine synthase A, putative / location=Cvel_scaffold2626:6300-11933(-) / protein_length=681 / sequence_SO=supercontig / SO=protein_coding / is_pseudo=false